MERVEWPVLLGNGRVCGVLLAEPEHCKPFVGGVSPVKRKASSGFTLVELAIVLLVTGILMVAYLDASRLWLETRYHDVTMARMRLIQEAMTHYIASNGAYPCPTAPFSYNPDDIQSDDCTTLNLTQIKQAEKHGIVFINYNNRQIIEGAVPFRLLNIPRESALDGWDNQFTYAITTELTDHSTFNANRGAIGIIDENDKSMLNPPASALWALVSHGPDGSGVYHDGAATANSCPPGRRETINCNHLGRFAVAPTSFADNKGFYDDIVFYRTWVDYPPDPPEKYCSITLQKGALRPTLVQDGMMIEVCGNVIRPLTNNGAACQFLICHRGQFVPGVINLIQGSN
jgi:prepilin-type N-terminal cleavage/methylation domain-containing protein